MQSCVGMHPGVGVTIVVVSILLGLPAVPSFAQGGEDPASDEDREPIDIEVPVLILDVESESVADEQMDLANIVQTAARAVTTVQEAPAIVTVVTGQDLRERGYDTLGDVLDTVPGWMNYGAEFNQFPFPLVRGTLQSMLFMHNGLSLFDPAYNLPQVGRIQPLETVKRIEVVTGPGGVLWGANSYMGIVNVVTKTATDVDGVEVGVRGGDGPGDRRAFYGYAMAGASDLLVDDLSLFIHGSVANFKGPEMEMPQHLYSLPLPQPNSSMIYGPLTSSDQPLSTHFLLDGTLRYGSLDVSFFFPFVEDHTPLGFPGVVTDPTLAERNLVGDDGAPLCPEVPLHAPDGARNPAAYGLNDPCVDRARIGGDNQRDYTDRYVTGHYQTRFAAGSAGMSLRAYLVEFDRSFQQLNVLAPSSLAEGGLSFRFDGISFRSGGSLDGDLELPGSLQLLAGAEAFREWVPDDIRTSRQGAGQQANAIGPADLTRVPLSCPVRPDADQPGSTELVPDCPLTMQFEIDRTVVGGYLNPRWKVLRRLMVDSGVRLQAGYGRAEYEPQLIFSGGAVYELAKDWHAKVNYTEGFRPPVFNNLASNGEAIQIDGDRDLEVETSQAIQGELNARLFKGVRRLREVNFRADYSYSRLQNLIQIIGGRYQNTADRGIHSAELLAKVFLYGDHRFEIGYTWLRIDAADFGRFRTMPEHWFNVGGVFSLVQDELLATLTMKVAGAAEDPNRLVEYRDLAYEANGTIGATVEVAAYEKVMDRIPPAAELLAGLTYVGLDDFTIRGFVYNAFNTRHYNPDAFHSMDPRLEILPNPYPDLRAVVSATYKY